METGVNPVQSYLCCKYGQGCILPLFFLKREGVAKDDVQVRILAVMTF